MASTLRKTVIEYGLWYFLIAIILAIAVEFVVVFKRSLVVTERNPISYFMIGYISVLIVGFRIFLYLSDYVHFLNEDKVRVGIVIAYLFLILSPISILYYKLFSVIVFLFASILLLYLDAPPRKYIPFLFAPYFTFYGFPLYLALLSMLVVYEDLFKPYTIKLNLYYFFFAISMILLTILYNKGYFILSSIAMVLIYLHNAKRLGSSSLTKSIIMFVLGFLMIISMYGYVLDPFNFLSFLNTTIFLQLISAFFIYISSLGKRGTWLMKPLTDKEIFEILIIPITLDSLIGIFKFLYFESAYLLMAFILAIYGIYVTLKIMKRIREFMGMMREPRGLIQ